MLDLWHALMANVAVIGIVVAGWSYTEGLRRTWPDSLSKAAFGLVLGAAVIVLMLTPVRLAEGIQFDLRLTPVAIAGFFAGPVGAAICLILAAGYRTILGGGGLSGALLGMGLVAAMSLLWGSFRRKREPALFELLVLAGAAGLGSLGGMFLLPQPAQAQVWNTIALPLAGFTSFATLAAALLLRQDLQRRRTSHENEAYRTIIEALPDGLTIKDRAGRFTAVNPASVLLMGKSSADEILGKSDRDIYSATEARQIRANDALALESDTPLAMEQKIERPGRSPVWVSTLKIPYRSAFGDVVGLITHNHDITARKALEKQLVDSRNQFAKALSEMADGLAMFDAESRLVFCNDQYRSYFPLTSDVRVPGARFRDILEAVVDRGEQMATLNGDPREWINAIETSLHALGEEEVHLYDGRWLHVRTRPGRDGTSMVVVSDITQVKRAEIRLRVLTEQLQLLASTDGMTELMNRRAFDETLDIELRRSARDRRPLSLLLLDIDRFKAYNDLYGHPAGDACLRAVSACFRQTLKRPADVVARYGGEEFAVLLPDTDEDGAFHVADALRRSLHDRALEHEGGDRGIVTVSVGIAAFVPDDQQQGASDLVARADAALYDAKSAGRDRIFGRRGNAAPPARRLA